MELEKLPTEFDLLKEYIVGYSVSHVTYCIPVGTVQYDRETLLKFFKHIDLTIHYFPSLDSREVQEGIIKPKAISHTITCYFKQTFYTPDSGPVKR